MGLVRHAVPELIPCGSTLFLKLVFCKSQQSERALGFVSGFPSAAFWEAHLFTEPLWLVVQMASVLFGPLAQELFVLFGRCARSEK